MRLALSLGSIVLASCVCAQGAPVTVAEANQAMDQIDAAVRKVLKLPAAKPSTDRATRGVTRAEVLERLERMFESYRPRFMYTPRPFRLEPDVAKKYNKDQATLARIEKLSRWGCIGPVGPLVVGADTVSVEALGDSLGYFMAQIAALTHYADPKWTPALMPPP